MWWSRDIVHQLYDRLSIRDAIHLAMTDKCNHRRWIEYLQTHVQPFIGFRTSPQHLALILAEFQGMVGKRGITYRHPITKRQWWLFSKKALDRMIAPGLRKFFTRITVDRYHRVMECVGHQPDSYAVRNTRHMMECFEARFEEQRTLARQAAEKHAINHATLHESVVRWIVGVERVRHTWPVLWALAVNQQRNKQFVKADIELLRDTAIHGFFCTVTDYMYGDDTASSVLVCRAVIKKHQNELWCALVSGQAHSYLMTEFEADLERAVNDFKRRIAERLLSVCLDERIVHLDAARVLARQCRDLKAIDPRVMRLVRRITRLKLIEIWDVIRYHLYAPSLMLPHQLVDFISQCFPHRITAGVPTAPLVPLDRSCIYSSLQLELVFNPLVDYVNSVHIGSGSPEYEWFIQQHRTVNVAKLAREIDWNATVHCVLGLRTHNVLAVRHAILRSIWKLQKLEAAMAPPQLWLPTATTENEVDRAAKRARLIES